jgi:hypothetical protein
MSRIEINGEVVYLALRADQTRRGSLPIGGAPATEAQATVFGAQLKAELDALQAPIKEHRLRAFEAFAAGQQLEGISID